MRANVVLIVDAFPELSQTFVAAEAVALAELGAGVHIEARGRARTVNPDLPPNVPPVAYAEDDARADRLRAMIALAARHPLGCVADLLARRRWRREEDVSPLRVLAPVAERVRRAGAGHLHAHFATQPALDAMRLARILGLPWSFAAHGYDIHQRPANLPEKLRRATFAVAPSQYTLAHLRGVAGDAAERLHEVIMGVDAARFARTRPYPGGRRLLAVGRLVEKKGFTTLIEAVALLERRAPIESLTIIGDGPLHDELLARVGRLGLAARVRLAGARGPAAVREALDAADVLVMPCVVAPDGDRDSMPVVVKEALAMEVPVVASDEVGLPELVRDGWGRLAPPGDAEGLATAIEELLALPAERRAQMGAAGRAFVREHCDGSREAAKLLELIDPTPRRVAAGASGCGGDRR